MNPRTKKAAERRAEKKAVEAFLAEFKREMGSVQLFGPAASKYAAKLLAKLVVTFVLHLDEAMEDAENLPGYGLPPLPLKVRKPRVAEGGGA